MDVSEICNHADNATLYACTNKLENVQKSLEMDLVKTVIWYTENQMKMFDKSKKTHLMNSIKNGNSQPCVDIVFPIYCQNTKLCNDNRMHHLKISAIQNRHKIMHEIMKRR